MFQDGASNATQTVSSASMQLPVPSAKVAILSAMESVSTLQIPPASTTARNVWEECAISATSPTSSTPTKPTGLLSALLHALRDTMLLLSTV